MNNTPANLTLPFENLESSLQKRVNAEAKTIVLNRGETPFLSDELEKHLYVVQEGKIKNFLIKSNF